LKPSNLPLIVEDQPDADDLVIVRQGLNTYNMTFGFPPVTELATFVRDESGNAVGGAYGELGWGWLYIDLLWLDESRRGQGEGARLIYTLEQAALVRGVEHIHLATTSFQALPFYHSIGYRLFGTLENRPPGWNYYYLRRQVQFDPITTLEVTDTPAVDDMTALKRGLSAHNRSRGAKADGKRLAIFLRDADGAIHGGLLGATYWGWFDLQEFWLDAPYRGQGIGSEMLALAETEALVRSCPHVMVDVADFQVTDFFHRRGYIDFAVLEDRPPGHKTHFMKKHLQKS